MKWISAILTLTLIGCAGKTDTDPFGQSTIALPETAKVRPYFESRSADGMTFYIATTRALADEAAKAGKPESGFKFHGRIGPQQEDAYIEIDPNDASMERDLIFGFKDRYGVK